MASDGMLPVFLIIGAMKAGTTTLFSDLSQHPRLHGAEDKEPEALTRDDILTPAGVAAYRRQFREAHEGQVCFEASTAYTKLPEHGGVAARAVRVLGPAIRVIYVVRDPVERALSHHRYSLAHGTTKETDIRKAVRADPSLLNISRYGMQSRPWAERLGVEGMLLLRFEDYVAARRQTLDGVCNWLGVGPFPPTARVDIAYNRSDEVVLARRGLIARWRRSRVYRDLIRPHLSLAQRHALKQLLPRVRAPAPDPVDLSVRRELAERLAPDRAELEAIFGSQAPRWDPGGGGRRASGEPTA